MADGSDDDLGAALQRLWSTIEARRSADPASSYTARLIAEGPLKCAKKLGEEAVETALAAVCGDDAALAGEAADLLYHLFVVLAVRGIGPGHVAEALTAREGISGLDEKKARKSP